MSTLDRPAPAPLVRRALGAFGGVVLGLVLLVAAWGKALDPVAFAEEIRTKGLEILLSAPVLAVLFVAFEAALGVALLVGLRRLWVLVPTTALVALFVFLNGRAYWRFAHGLIEAGDSCGCFGSLLSRTPAEAFWQDLLMLVPPLVLAFVGRAPRAGRPAYLRWALVALTFVVAAVFTHRAPGLPLDDLATRLKPGVKIGALCAGSDAEGSVRICLDGLAPELESGSHLAVIADVEDPVLAAHVPQLNALVDAPGAPHVWLLTASGEEAQAAFFWSGGPVFEIREVPETLLRALYRTMPRSFLVSDGVVTQTFSGIPTQGEIDSIAAAEGDPEPHR